MLHLNLLYTILHMTLDHMLQERRQIALIAGAYLLVQFHSVSYPGEEICRENWVSIPLFILYHYFLGRNLCFVLHFVADARIWYKYSVRRFVHSQPFCPWQNTSGVISFFMRPKTLKIAFSSHESITRVMSENNIVAYSFGFWLNFECPSLNVVNRRQGL